MKQLVLSVTMILFTLATIQAQSKKELRTMLERDLENYKRCYLTSNFDSAWVFMPPKMFEFVTRDSLVASIKAAYDNENMRLEVKSMTFTSKAKIKKTQNYHWAFVPYDVSIRMYLKGDENYKTVLTKLLKADFGEKNIIEEGKDVLLLKETGKNIIAYKDPASPVWSFLEDERKKAGDSKDLLYYHVIPKEIQEAVEKH